MNVFIRLSAACAGAATLLMALPVGAQNYPSRPIRMVTQFSAGSGGDALIRVFNAPLSETLGQPVVIENRAGAGGVQAAESIARATPDGYTFGALTPNVPVIRVVAGSKISIDPVKDLAPLMAVGSTPSLIVVHPSVPVRSFKELVDYTKKNPNKLSFGTSGIGSAHHLAYEEMRLISGMEMVHVPYKAGAQALMDVVTGQIPVGFVIISEALAQAKAGKIRILATREDKRLRELPDVPAVGEFIPGFEALPGWTGLFAPTGIPQPIFRRLSGDLQKTLAMPEVRDRVNQVGFDIIANTPDEFAAQIQREIALVAKVAKAANIKLD